MTKKSWNSNLRKANKAKNDEFYTQLSDIEKELSHYKEHLKDKIVFCNCDDPWYSNFFKYFVLQFKTIWLKRLITTHYDNEKPSYKLEVNSTNINQISQYIKNTTLFDDWGIFKNFWISLNENWDFRSHECIEILKKSDIVVTNPPFSLFREYVAQLFEYDKKFIILWNMNALTYKEIFKYIKENKLWTGYWFNLSLVYKSPYKNILEANRKFVMSKWYNPDDFIKVPAISWFTNIETKKRHEDLILYKTYNETEYQKYVNFDAINIDKITDIPLDYKWNIWVPITFLDKYNPEQFEIIWLWISNSWIEIWVKPYTEEHKKYRKEIQKRAAVNWDLYILKNWIVDVPYARVIIKNKKI